MSKIKENIKNLDNRRALSEINQLIKMSEKFKGKTWEVQAIDNISTENVIDVYLKEYFSNEVEDAYLKAATNIQIILGL